MRQAAGEAPKKPPEPQKRECVCKKIDCHMVAISFYLMFCNFVKIHKTSKTTPAIDARLLDLDVAPMHIHLV